MTLSMLAACARGPVYRFGSLSRALAAFDWPEPDRLAIGSGDVIEHTTAVLAFDDEPYLSFEIAVTA